MGGPRGVNPTTVGLTPPKREVMHGIALLPLVLSGHRTSRPPAGRPPATYRMSNAARVRIPRARGARASTVAPVRAIVAPAVPCPPPAIVRTRHHGRCDVPPRSQQVSGTLCVPSRVMVLAARPRVRRDVVLAQDAFCRSLARPPQGKSIATSPHPPAATPPGTALRRVPLVRAPHT